MAAQSLAQSLADAFDHLDRGRPAEARRIARAIEKQRPDLPGLDYLLGLLALEENNGIKAARHLARALTADPESPPLLLAAARAQAMQRRDDGAEPLYRRLLAAAPDAEAPKAELAALLLRRGLRARDDASDPESARAHFVEAARLDRQSVLAHWLLGDTLRAAGKLDEAAKTYSQVLALDPEDRYGAALALAVIGKEPAPERAPDAFLRAMFDQYAERFDGSLVGRLGYRAPELLARAVRAEFGTGPLAIFDAGCGTGLMGEALADIADGLDGADLSPTMIGKSRARGIYRELEAGNFVDILIRRPARYDLVVAADVLVYSGDLAPAFAAAAASLKPHGGFAFTVEQAEGSGWSLRESGRYAHSAPYLAECARRSGMEIRELDDVSTREDRGVPVPGWLCLARSGS